jgi:hypothetical protein
MEYEGVEIKRMMGPKNNGRSLKDLSAAGN